MAPISAGKRLAFIATTLLLCLLLLEGTLRGFGAVGGELGHRLASYDPLAMKFAPHGEHGYRQKPNTTYPFGNGTRAVSNSMSYRGPEVSVAKPAGTTRIILLGGSTTRGFGVENDETIDTYMREILAERLPDRRIEVVNLALGGYDSYQLFERMRTDGVPMDPDVLIINTGINDVRNARFPDLAIPGPDMRTLIWEDHLRRAREEAAQGGPSLWTRAKHHSYLLRLPGFVRQLQADTGLVEAKQTTRPLPSAIDYFAANVARTAALAQERGASVIYATPASRLGSYPPEATSTVSYWIVDAATTESYRRRLAQRLAELADEQRRMGLAVRYLDPSWPDDHFLEGDDCHLSPSGNRAAAQLFSEATIELLHERDAQMPTRTTGEARP